MGETRRRDMAEALGLRSAGVSGGTSEGGGLGPTVQRLARRAGEAASSAVSTATSVPDQFIYESTFSTVTGFQTIAAQTGHLWGVSVRLAGSLYWTGDDDGNWAAKSAISATHVGASGLIIQDHRFLHAYRNAPGDFGTNANHDSNGVAYGPFTVDWDLYVADGGTPSITSSDATVVVTATWLRALAPGES